MTVVMPAAPTMSGPVPRAASHGRGDSFAVSLALASADQENAYSGTGRSGSRDQAATAAGETMPDLDGAQAQRRGGAAAGADGAVPGTTPTAPAAGETMPDLGGAQAQRRGGAAAGADGAVPGTTPTAPAAGETMPDLGAAQAQRRGGAATGGDGAVPGFTPTAPAAGETIPDLGAAEAQRRGGAAGAVAAGGDGAVPGTTAPVADGDPPAPGDTSTAPAAAVLSVDGATVPPEATTDHAATPTGPTTGAVTGAAMPPGADAAAVRATGSQQTPAVTASTQGALSAALTSTPPGPAAVSASAEAIPAASTPAGPTAVSATAAASPGGAPVRSATVTATAGAAAAAPATSGTGAWHGAVPASAATGGESAGLAPVPVKETAVEVAAVPRPDVTAERATPAPEVVVRGVESVAGSVRTESAAKGEPAPAPAPAPPQPPPLGNQLAASLSRLKTAPDGHHVLNIRVDPEDLGPVRVTAHIGADGVRIELLGVTETAREALRGALTELRRELAATGLQADLDLASEERSAERGRPDRPAADIRRDPSQPEEPHAVPAAPIPGGGLDLLA